MKIKDAYDRLVDEYLSKVNLCDECCATWYCTMNHIRKSREPNDDCTENIKQFLRNTEYHKIKGAI